MSATSSPSQEHHESQARTGQEMSSGHDGGRAEKSSTGQDEHSKKSIRFFEYASVIPLLDLEQLHEDVDKAYGHHGRPHLSSRTYSVPIPTSFTQFFSSPPPREYTYDPSFIPNAPPRLNLKLPSFTRKRRNTISCQSHLKSCLKKRKTLLGASAAISPDQGYEKITPSTGKGKNGNARARAHTLASSAPSASTSHTSPPACIGSVNPVYCPALAKVVSEAHAFSPTAGVNPSTSPSTTSTTLSTTPPQSDITSQQQHLPPTPTELLPIRDCCRACRKAASYGQRCSDYHEHWSKAALEKRKRDEETLFERGEFVTGKKEHGEQVDEEELHEPARSIVKDAKVLEKEAKLHHGLHHSPLHSPLHSPTDLDRQHSIPSPPTCAPPLIAHAHAQIVAHQEARHEKQVAHAMEVDKARERIARLDVGKINRHDEEEDDQSSDSDCEQQQLMSPREGDGLLLEGIESSPASPTSPSGTIGKNTKADDDEVEKNPICTLEGNVLRPCSSRALYTGAPSIKSPKLTRQSSTSSRSSIEADRASTSSSELSDDILSNLSSLGLSPASATTNASSWFDHEELLHSPEAERTLEEGKDAHDYFPSVVDKESQIHEEGSAKSPPQSSEAREGNGCSPLMRSKACLRPMGMYNPAEDVMSQSCPTIKEEEGSLPTTPTPTPTSATPPPPVSALKKAAQVPSLHRSQTALTALEKEAELRAALVEADKPVFAMPSRSQSLPANAGRRHIEEEDAATEGRRARPSWTARFLHRGKGLASLGVAHGVVH